ncbi:MAG: hypothetical protein V2A71_05075, partial [Candidatus Eisenbacteria bacterium]
AQELLDRRQASLPEEERIRIKSASVEAGIVGESNVLAISYTDHDRGVAKTVTQALTDAYIGYRQETGLTPGLMQFFDKEIDGVARALDELRARREQFMTQKNVSDLSWKTRTLLEIWKGLTSDLNEVVVARVSEEANVAEMRRLLDSPDVDIPVLNPLPAGGDIVLSGLRQLRATLKLELEKTQANYTDKDHRVIALKRQLADLELQLDHEAKQAVVLSEAKLAPLAARESQLKRQVASVEAQLLGHPEQETVLADLDTRIEIAERDYATLTSKRIDAMVSKESSPEWRVVLLSPPSEAVAFRTKDYVRLSLGPLLGLLVGVGLAFLFDNLDHSIKTKTEAENLLGLPVVASIMDSGTSEKSK